MKKFYLVCAGIIGIYFLVHSNDNDKNKDSSNQNKPTVNNIKEDKIIEAWVMAKEFVKRELISPGTADFGSLFKDYQNPNDHVVELGPDTFRVQGWVDAQNQFGALIRQHFVVVIKDNGDRWQAIDGPNFY